MDTQIVPDAATCPACLAEMRDPRERRYRYPFINCTHCGPRFTIIRAMPYDRPATSMAHFRSACRVKRSIATRRSALSRPAGRLPGLRASAGMACGRLSHARQALSAAVAMLKNGGIVAVKGLGGFHLSATRKSAGGGDASGTQTAPDKAAGGDDPACGPAGAGQALLRSPAPIVLTPKAWLPDSRGDRTGPGLCGHHAPGEPAAAFADDGLPAPAGDDLRQPQRQTACHPISRRWTSSGILPTVFCCTTATSCSGWMIR
jgi:hydrogenase maturation protein HypF